MTRLVDRYRNRHQGWNVKHYTAWYKREGGLRSTTWVKNTHQQAGVVNKAPCSARSRTKSTIRSRRSGCTQTLVFDLRARHKRGRDFNQPLRSMSRPTAYRLVKRVMARAGITGKGLRHGFGVAMVTGDKPLPIHMLSRLMDHSDTQTTEIYLQVVGQEVRQLVAETWGR